MLFNRPVGQDVDYRIVCVIVPTATGSHFNPAFTRVHMGITGNTDQTVPILTEGLGLPRSRGEVVYWAPYRSGPAPVAALALQHIGPPAAPALPSLREVAATAEDDRLRCLARGAIAAITAE